MLERREIFNNEERSEITFSLSHSKLVTLPDVILRKTAFPSILIFAPVCGSREALAPACFFPRESSKH